MRIDTRDALFTLRRKIRNRAKDCHDLAKSHNNFVDVMPTQADKDVHAIVCAIYGILGQTLDGVAEDIVNTVTEVENMHSDSTISELSK